MGLVRELLIIILNISTKLYGNTTMTCKVTSRTSSDGRMNGRKDGRTDTQPKLKYLAHRKRAAYIMQLAEDCRRGERLAETENRRNIRYYSCIW